MDAREITRRYDQLAQQRKNLDSTFQVIEKYVVPFRGNFFRDNTSEQEVEWRRRNIYDSTAVMACSQLAAQIHSNLTSPAIRWFELRWRDEELNDDRDAKIWLQDTQERIWQALQDSDFNTEVSEIYLDLTGFGTAILFGESRDEKIWRGINFTAVPLENAYIEFDSDGRLIGLYRGLEYTKPQLIDKFGKDKLPQEISIDKDEDKKYKIVFCVYPRKLQQHLRDVSKTIASKQRPFAFKYVLHNSDHEFEEGGYYEMPAFAPRWQKVSGSVWGFSPAHVCLSDILQLQQTVSANSEARDKAIDPPMKTTERGLLSDLDLTAGGLTVVADMNELEELFDPHRWRFDAGEAEIIRLQQSVNRAFYVDRLELKDSPAMTATEALIRYERMQRQFAPTLGRLQTDLLEGVVMLTYHLLLRAGQLKEVPAVVANNEMDIEFTGPVARSQKNEVAQNMSIWINELGALASVIPEMLDTVDTDYVARHLGELRGVAEAAMRSQKDVAAIRQQRAEAAAREREIKNVEMATRGARNMASAQEKGTRPNGAGQS